MHCIFRHKHITLALLISVKNCQDYVGLGVLRKARILLHLCVLFQVYSVEEEMRELLQEMANNKKVMESKIRRLTHALNDIQQGFEGY